MILDTDFLIDLIKGDKQAENKAEKLEKQKIQQKLSSATVFELYTGIKRSQKPEEEKEKVKDVISSKQVIKADQKIMEKAGKLHGKKVNTGERLPSFDTIIASTAMIKQEKLLTNDKHFKKITGLETENY